MLAEAATQGGAGAAGGGAFPPFALDTYPSQLFWLAVTFVLLLVLMWRVVGPKLGGVVAARKDKIDGDLAAAAKSKEDAEAALDAYNTALAEARGRAHKLADETRKAVNDEIDAAKADADAQAKAASAEAESRIVAMRAEAAQHVTKAAQDAAVAIVGRLIGETVSSEEAERAVQAIGA